MNDEMFVTWLRKSKGMKERSAKDVLSRLRRAKALLNNLEFTEQTLDTLDNVDAFLNLSIAVRSQLRRSISLYLEYISK